MSAIRELPLPDGHLDLLAGRVHREGPPVRLTPTEIAALSVLADHAPDPVSEEELLRLAWGYRTTNTRTVSMTMSRIRGKIERDPRSPSVLLTVRGQGYRLVPADTAAEAPLPPTPQPVVAPPATPLVAREAELQAVQSALSDGVRCIQLIGAGGIGKSTVARSAIAGRNASWVPVEDADGAAGVVRRIADALDVEGDRAAVAAAIGKLDILVVDSAEALEGAGREALASLVQDADTTLLLTTRVPVDLPGLTGSAAGERRVLMGPLDRDAAVRVIQQQRRDNGLPEVDPSLLNPLLDAFGGHPLALTVAAPILDFDPTADVVLSLTDDGASRSLQGVIEQTLASLPDASRSLLATLSTFAVPPRAPQVAERTGLPLPLLLRELHELRTRGLVGLDHGRVAVHAFVRQVARTEAAMQAHIEWVAGYPQEPGLLRPLRHELEQILPLARGDALAEALFRHALVLHAFGPTDQVVADVIAGTARLPNHLGTTLLEGIALVVADEGLAAQERLRAGLLPLADRSDEAALTWRARGLLYLDFASNQSMDKDGALTARDALIELRPHVPNATLRHFLTIPVATHLARQRDQIDDPVQNQPIEKMLREVEAEGTPQIAFIAALHRMLLLPTSASEVRSLETRLLDLGQDAMGARGWARRWLDIAHLHAIVGQPDLADAVLSRHASDALVYDVADVRNIALCAAHVVSYRPDLAERWLSHIPKSHPSWARTRWLIDRPEGPVPFEDPALVELLDAWRSGAPLPFTRAYFHLRRALSNRG